MPGHDGCLYEAVIYFIIGGRGRYNPRLGNEAIREESAGRFSRFNSSSPSSRRRPRARQRKFDRSANHPALWIALFTAANRNYSSRKNTRIRGPRHGPGPLSYFRERALSGIASRQLALKPSNRFSGLFARPKAQASPRLSSTFHGIVAHVCLFIKRALVPCSIHL